MPSAPQQNGPDDQQKADPQTWLGQIIENFGQQKHYILIGWPSTDHNSLHKHGKTSGLVQMVNWFYILR
jgi:hypothetical protein